MSHSLPGVIVQVATPALVVADTVDGQAQTKPAVEQSPSVEHGCKLTSLFQVVLYPHAFP
jgi:hypothetical protein